MGTISSSRTISIPFYARISVPERLFSGILTVMVRNANDGNEATDDFMTRYDDNFSNAQTRNIDDAAPFTAAQRPSSEKFASSFSTDGDLLLETNGGSNSINSSLADTNHDWKNIANNNTDGIATSSGALVFTPQSTGASANEQGVKLKRSLSLGTSNLNMKDYLFRTKPGGRYKLRISAKIESTADTNIYYAKVIFDDSSSYTSSAFVLNHSSYTSCTFDFTISPDTNLDEIQFYALDPSNTGSFYVDTFELFELISQDRTGYGHSIGDYDVLVYHVTGGCHLSSTLEQYKQNGTAGSYYSSGELSGYPDTSSSTWAKHIDHPACQNFVKWTLLSRHNNSYEHQTWKSTPVFTNTDELFEDMDKSVYTYHRDGVETSSAGSAENYYNYGALNTGIGVDDGYPQSMIEKDEYLMVNSSSISSGGQSEGLSKRRKQIYSTASASHVTKSGLDQSTSTIGRDMRSGIAHVGTVDDMGANKYFSPVHRVDIYASHPFILTDQTSGGATQTHSTHGKLVRVQTHDTSFWQLVVNVKVLAANSTGGIDSARDFEFFKNRININFQPMGETQNIIFSTTSHTT